MDSSSFFDDAPETGARRPSDLSCFGELGELDSSLDSLSSEDSIILESLFASPARGGKSAPAEKDSPMKKMRRLGPAATDAPPLDKFDFMWSPERKASMPPAEPRAAAAPGADGTAGPVRR
eukprot:CAMPEP_0182891008 /NCGR_PEP_ID=MMETSP0034_2-20130328/22996_1 /TAXON_ID=156128 /ORGANISM="Nephroselmis pyriformis, Strain CCMP717" /LENGTH=120 /DNA_ID=CAMNT_0025024595 /DNA_START=188 /DNA_END=546 /DNA_ORIENTATION=-